MSDDFPYRDVEDCGACTGESCYKCGAGVWRFPFSTGVQCDHDVLDRHENIFPDVCDLDIYP